MHRCLHKKRHAKIFVVILTLLFYFCYIKKIQSIVFWNDDRLITIVITQGLLIFFWCYFALASFLYRHTLSNKSVRDFYHHSLFSNVPTFLFWTGGSWRLHCPPFTSWNLQFWDDYGLNFRYFWLFQVSYPFGKTQCKNVGCR